LQRAIGRVLNVVAATPSSSHICFPAKGDARRPMQWIERLNDKAKRAHRRNIDTLPDGAMVTLDGEAFAVRGRRLLRWAPSGYSASRARPREINVDVLTPPSILSVLARGYTPVWHSSAH
jgi:hypothetical protein